MSDDPQLDDVDLLESLCITAGATVGGTMAGPLGVAIGGMAGRLLKHIIADHDDFSYGVLTNLTSDAISGGFGTIGLRIQARLMAKPRPEINNALQTALNQALRAAVVDIGGPDCFKAESKNAPKAPNNIVYRYTPSGSRLWQDDSGLGTQIDDFLHAVAQQTTDLAILGGAVDAQVFLQATTPQVISSAFYDAVVRPVLAGRGSFQVEASGFLAHLRMHLFNRTAAHLGELLNRDAGAWRTFNRLVLEEVLAEIVELADAQIAGQAKIIRRMDALLSTHDGVTHVASQLIALFTWMGEIRQEQTTNFDQLFARLDEFQELLLQQQTARESLHIGVPSDAPKLVGRDKILAGIIARLLAGETLVIHGRGGIGKTALALVVASHPQIISHFDGGLLWAGLGTSPNVAEVLERWGRALKIDVTKCSQVEDLSQSVRDAIGTRRFLFILDDSWGEVETKLLCCGGPNSVYLLTTRTQSVASAFVGKESTIEVQTLTRQSANKLLRSLAPLAWRIDAKAMQELATAVDHLPLSLELMGISLSAPENNIFTELTQAGVAHLANPDVRLQLAKERLGQKGGKLTLAEVVELSLTGLPDQAIRTFYALGAFAPQPARFGKVAAMAVTGFSLHELSLLHDRGLLEVGKDESLSLHQTIAEVAKRKLELGTSERHCDHYLQLIRESHKQWWKIEDAYGQIQHAWKQLADDNTLIFEFLNYLMKYQDKRGLWRECEAWVERGLRLAEAQKDPHTIAGQIHNLGAVYAIQGRWSKAIAKFEAALTIYDELQDWQAKGHTLTNFGVVYCRAGKWDEAIEKFEAALVIFREYRDRQGEGDTLSNLGAVYIGQERWQEALDVFVKTLVISRELMDDHLEARALNNLGNTYVRRGEWNKAQEIYEASLDVFLRLGDRHGEGQTLGNLGNIYIRHGYVDKALTLTEKALAIFRGLGDKPGESIAFGSLGSIYARQARWTEAIGMYEAELALQQPLGDRQGMGRTLNHLGEIYQRVGRWTEAKEMHSAALKIYRETGNRQRECETIGNLGVLEIRQGHFVEAIKKLLVSLKTMREFGDVHGEGQVLNNLGIAYEAQKQWTKAIEQYETSLSVKRSIGGLHWEGETLGNLGNVYRKLGDGTKATAYYEEALGKLHPDSPEHQELRQFIRSDDAERDSSNPNTKN